MIYADQLRVYNWVKYDGKFYRLAAVDHYIPHLDTIEYGTGVVEYRFLEPILLTPELLLKTGFTKVSNSEWFVNFWDKNKYGIVHCIKDEPIRGFKEGKFYCGVNEIEIPSFHWLQNHYYFSINPGIELPIPLEFSRTL